MTEKIELGKIFCGEYSEDCQVDRLQCPFRMTSENPRQFNYRDESALLPWQSHKTGLNKKPKKIILKGGFQ